MGLAKTTAAKFPGDWAADFTTLMVRCQWWRCRRGGMPFELDTQQLHLAGLLAWIPCCRYVSSP